VTADSDDSQWRLIAEAATFALGLITKYLPAVVEKIAGGDGDASIQAIKAAIHAVERNADPAEALADLRKLVQALERNDAGGDQALDEKFNVTKEI